MNSPPAARGSQETGLTQPAPFSRYLFIFDLVLTFWQIGSRLLLEKAFCCSSRSRTVKLILTLSGNLISRRGKFWNCLTRTICSAAHFFQVCMQYLAEVSESNCPRVATAYYLSAGSANQLTLEFLSHLYGSYLAGTSCLCIQEIRREANSSANSRIFFNYDGVFEMSLLEKGGLAMTTRHEGEKHWTVIHDHKLLDTALTVWVISSYLELFDLSLFFAAKSESPMKLANLTNVETKSIAPLYL